MLVLLKLSLLKADDWVRCQFKFEEGKIWGGKEKWQWWQWYKLLFINPLSANSTKGSNTLKQFVGNSPTNCLSEFDHFVGFAFKVLNLRYLKICSAIGAYFHFKWKCTVSEQLPRGVLQKSCSEKFRKSYRKTPVLESNF